MNGTNNAGGNATMTRPAGKPGYHAGDALIRRMMINLTTNNANPEALEEFRDAKEMAMVDGGDAKAAPAPAATAAPEGASPVVP
jgi:hypothetical protein